MDKQLEEKYSDLKKILREGGSAAIAFSAGIDSMLLLAVAQEVLEDNIAAFTAVSPAFPKAETAEAEAFCKDRKIRHYLFKPDELLIEGFDQNPLNRCYICKKRIFERMSKIASQHGFLRILEGSNVDDLGDYRPGRQALGELQIESPLLQANFTKKDIRTLAQELGLVQWDKPSMACLYSRFPYGQTLTEEKLSMVEKAEAFLHELGFINVRVRMDGKTARLEVDEAAFPALMKDSIRYEICQRLKELGFTYVSLDLEGYRTGSMNETIETQEMVS